MSSTATGAALAECTALLDVEGRRAVRRYWEQVIWEEWVPPSRREGYASDGGAARRARQARRAMARVAAAGRLAPVVSLSTLTPVVAGVSGSGVAA